MRFGAGDTLRAALGTLLLNVDSGKTKENLVCVLEGWQLEDRCLLGMRGSWST